MAKARTGVFSFDIQKLSSALVKTFCVGDRGARSDVVPMADSGATRSLVDMATRESLGKHHDALHLTKGRWKHTTMATVDMFDK